MLPEDTCSVWTTDGPAGRFTVRNTRTNDDMDTLRTNVRYVCSVCGRVWAAREWSVFDGYNRGPTAWRGETLDCRSCGDGRLLSFAELTPRILWQLPPSLINHEFLAHTQHTEQYI